MSDSEYIEYPRGQIGMGTGNLKQCTNAKFSFTNNGKSVHTIASSPAGFVRGVSELSGTLEFVVPETGMEYDLLDDVKKGKRRQFRFKDATTTDEIVGILVSFDKEIPMDDAVKVSVGYIGKLVD